MKKCAAMIAGLTAIILLTQTNLLSDLLLFILVGAIPGTTKSVPSHIMLSAIVLLTTAFVFSSATVRRVALRLFVSLRATLLDLKAQYNRRSLGDA